MGLKQSIVVRSQFNVKGPSGEGSRGSTPGDYVKRYAARADATEEMAPVRLHRFDDFTMRYMARDEATEQAFDSKESIGELKPRYRNAQKFGGRTFGSKNISLSHEELLDQSNAAQKAFDEGRTLIMPIISFEEEYLREQGIIAEDFHCKKRGDYRGNIDQMKLRLAINEGLKRMARRFDDLEWIGAIQVDTEHVHCHLLLWDKGEGDVLPNGQQRGKLTERDMMQLRRGIDLQLDRTKSLQRLSANITDDKRNVRCFVKRYAHEVMLDAGLPQFLLACLPEDKRLWRASSHREEMRKPNAIVREFVTQLLSEDPKGAKAMADVQLNIGSYVQLRAEREDLDERQQRELLDRSFAAVVDDCCNGVYDVLRNIPDAVRETRTPLLDIMSMEYDTVRENLREESTSDPLIEFGFKLRSYASRLGHHREQFKRYRKLAHIWEDAIDRDEQSQPMYDFYSLEARYHEQLMAKYQHFLAFIPDSFDYEKELADVEDYGRRRDNLRMMIEDETFNRFKIPASAEAYGVATYGQRGGSLMLGPSKHVLEERLRRMDRNYDQKIRDFREHMSDHAQSVDELYEEDADGKQRLKLRLRQAIPYDFDDVKALDLHHLAYDFPYHADVSKVNIDAFVEMANARAEAVDNAVEYLERTGQNEFVEELPISDVRLAMDLVRSFEERSLLMSKRVSATAEQRPAYTIALSESYTDEVRSAVLSTIESAQAVVDSGAGFGA